MVFSLRKVGGDALSLLTSDVLNRATSFVIYAMVARHLSAQEFGQLTLAFSLFYMFQIFATAGLKVFVIREAANDRSLTRLYFLNSRAILTVSSLLSVSALPGIATAVEMETAEFAEFHIGWAGRELA